MRVEYNTVAQTVAPAETVCPELMSFCFLLSYLAAMTISELRGNEGPGYLPWQSHRSPSFVQAEQEAVTNVDDGFNASFESRSASRLACTSTGSVGLKRDADTLDTGEARGRLPVMEANAIDAWPWRHCSSCFLFGQIV